MSKKKGKKSSMYKILKKLGFLKFLKRNGLILFLILSALIMILTIVFIEREKTIVKNISSNLARNQDFIISVNRNFELRNKEKNSHIIEEDNILEEKAAKAAKVEKELEEKEKQEVKKELKDLDFRDKNIFENKEYFSCNDLLRNGEKKNGIYEISVRGEKKKIKVYCDMKTSGGGWTLLLTSASNGWNTKNILSLNSENPSVMDNYSVLKYGDNIKTIVGGKFEYRIDANHFGENGGVWEAEYKYSFISNKNTNTDVILTEKYGDWYYSTYNIEKRMPYICNSEYGTLTTSGNCSVNWYGTLAAKGGDFVPAPWLHSTIKEPGIIWYWVR